MRILSMPRGGEALNASTEADRVKLAGSHMVAGSRNRFRIGLLGLRIDEAWRTEMRARYRRLVTFLTCPFGERFD